MKSPPPLPNLASLTSAQKDELIVDLWETLRAIEDPTEFTQQTHPVAADARGTNGDGSRPSLNELRARIARSAPSQRRPLSLSGSHRPLTRFDFLVSKTALVTIAIVGLGFLADFGVGWTQHRLIDRKERAALELRNAAFSGLYLELLRVAYEPDGKSYRATVTMQNQNPTAPLYVMLDPMRVFVQTGMTWQEVPSNSASKSIPRLIKLDGAKEYSIVFQADLKDWAELLPGYMHMRIQSDMLISQNSEPEDDIVARNNRFYVYLKPQGSDDSAIKRRGNFPGAPPIFIPMPPH
jgi:hypothetical protein